MTRDDITTLLDRGPEWFPGYVEAMIKYQPSILSDVDDIVREAKTRVLKKAERLWHCNQRQVYGYLKRVAQNIVRDLCRDPYVKYRVWLPDARYEDRWHQRKEEGDYTLGRFYMPDAIREDADFQEMIIDVRIVLSRLSPLERLIAELNAEGYRVREIADMLGMPKSTIHTWWRRQIAPRLRRELRAYGGNLFRLLRKEREQTLKWMPSIKVVDVRQRRYA